MVDVPALKLRRHQRSFASWDEFVPTGLVAQSEEAVRQLIDRLLTLGPNPTREQAQEEIDGCVRRFNDLHWDGHTHPWICTIEREDICEALYVLVDLCGFRGSEEWTGERDW